MTKKLQDIFEAMLRSAEGSSEFIAFNEYHKKLYAPFMSANKSKLNAFVTGLQNEGVFNAFVNQTMAAITAQYNQHTRPEASAARQEAEQARPLIEHTYRQMQKGLRKIINNVKPDDYELARTGSRFRGPVIEATHLIARASFQPLIDRNAGPGPKNG